MLGIRSKEEQTQQQELVVLTTDCAWCLEEQGLPMGEGSHGVCTPHAEEVWRKHQEAKQARKRH